MTDFKAYLAQYEKLLPVGSSISYTEAERRAGEFLSAMATITTWRYEFGKEKIRYQSTQTAVYAQQMALGNSKTVTENKLNAEASPEFTEARESLEHIENDLAYLKGYYEIMLNGHLFYRNLAKGENV